MLGRGGGGGDSASPALLIISVPPYLGPGLIDFYPKEKVNYIMRGQVMFLHRLMSSTGFIIHYYFQAEEKGLLF